MDRSAFLKLLAARFYPVLRAEGFKGSGTALRRHDGDFHHIVAVQGAAGGAGCYINLGAHIDFLPAEGGGPFDPATFDEPSCAFRMRLDAPDGPHWRYGATEAEAQATVAALLAAWGAQGQAFFAGFTQAGRASQLEGLIAAREGSQVHAAHALLGARIALHTGDAARAQRMATAALPRVPERATALRAKLEALVATAGAAGGTLAP
ncbi:MAG: DUF4304 domain-containing protein [Variovorax sp.]|nr:MAG: DUF4304 domain-containing protein [Variovorax sp.]